MGVIQLWQILAPVQQHKPLSSLAGQTLAVDLSIWVCETQCVKQMQGVVSKPFLRNLFFRILHLTQLGVKLVFVVEGTAPELKWEAMMKRQQMRFPGKQGRQPQHRQGRRNFNSCLKQCCQLLDILGIPYVQSQGEAEAMCAVLNAVGLVDGCLTNDGDAFLYGATVVYRNFTMNTKDPHVESYRMVDIQTELGIDREGLVALALLLGCDYVPKGVPGVGPANAVKLLQTLRGRNVLKRLREWKTMSESQCLDQVEVLMRRKAVVLPDFPQEKVINEFLVSKDKCPRVLPSWKRPIIHRLQDFALEKLEWPIEYGLEKVLPLVTLWDMRDIVQSKQGSSSLHLKPHRIVKSRVRQGVPCYEVEWHKPATDTTCPDDYYTTVEEQDLFSQCYPQTVDDFNSSLEEKRAKKSSKGAKKKKKVEEQNSHPESTQTAVSSQPTSNHIADELSNSFASLKVDDRKTDQANSLGNEMKEIKIQMKSKARKCPQDKLFLSGLEKPYFHESENEEVPSVSSEVNKECDENDQLDNCNEEVLDISDNDSFIPLSQRVKKKLQARNDRFDHLVAKTGLISVLGIKETYDENVNLSKTELSKIKGNTDNHQGMKFCLESAIDFENVDGIDHISDQPEVGDTVKDDSVLGTEKHEKCTKDLNKQRNKQISYTPKVYLNQSESNTPLSLQKQFMNDRFNTKASSPFEENYSCPVTYIKQNFVGNETHSFIEIIDTPDNRKPEILVTMVSDDVKKQNIASEIENVNKSSSLFKENIEKLEISEAFHNVITMKSSDALLEKQIVNKQNILSKKETVDSVFRSCKVNADTEETPEMHSSVFRVLELDQIHLESLKKDATNYFSTTPLYSANRCVQNISQTMASPLHLLGKSRLNLSELSLLDMPNFNVQTSLLNSLCKTFDVTSSPASFDVSQLVGCNDVTDKSFVNLSKQATIEKHKASQVNLENLHCSEVEINPDSVYNAEVEIGQKIIHYGDRHAFLSDCVPISPFRVAKVTKNEEVVTKEPAKISEGIEVMKPRFTKLLDNNMTKTHQEKTENVTETNETKNRDLLQTSNLLEKNNNVCEKREDKSSQTVRQEKDGKSEDAKTLSIEGSVLKDRKYKENTQGKAETVNALEKPKLGKMKGGRKKKKKGVKKASAFMDLSHDGDESLILSQMMSSQSTDSQIISSQRIASQICKENTVLKSTETLRVPLDNANNEQTNETENNKENIGTKAEVNNLADSVNEIALLHKAINANMKSDEHIDEVAKDKRENNDLNSEGQDWLPMKNEYLNFVDDNFPVKLKSAIAVDSTVTVDSPVSLADRLKKRLKNSSTRQVLTDFMK